jgi:polyphenol oxidase
VHGADVVVVTTPGQHAGAAADAMVTATAGCTLAVRTADCAPVVLEGAWSVGVVHAGWRGLLDGVVANTAASMRELGDEPRRAAIGPCIRAGCYEFGESELGLLVGRFGERVRATTMWGTPAFDLAGAVQLACRAEGIDDVDDSAGCTACDLRWFSHRARRETERFATLAWITDPEVAP